MSSKSTTEATSAEKIRVGYVDGIVSGPDMLAGLSALFPDIEFTSVGPVWPQQKLSGLAALISPADVSDLEALVKRVTSHAGEPPIILALPKADPAIARRLLMAGAADLLTSPVREAALALSLERLMAGRKPTSAPTGKVISIVGAGGGVGSTAIGTQLALILAARRTGVCFADLDVQFGLAALKFDIDDAMTVADVLGGDGALEEAPLASVLATHRSGVRLLAAPRDVIPLEAVTQQNIEGLIKSLRREFALTLIDLPTAWTAWTNQAMHLSDQIIMVTNLTVPHIQLTKRQFKTLSSQGLDVIPLTLVCNNVGEDHKAIVSVAAAEKALGRKFHVVIPEDRRLMTAAVAQGCSLAEVRPDSKLERAIEQLAAEIDPDSVPKDVKPRRRWL